MSRTLARALEILEWFLEHRSPTCPCLRACRIVGLPVGRKAGGYTIHHLRHAFVSHAHDAGLSAGVIMAHTGHVQEPTMLPYLRTSGTAQQRAQEQLEAYRREQVQQVRERAKKLRRLPHRNAG